MIVGDYTLTFENAGGKKSVRNFFFETEAKCVDFIRVFNSLSRKSKITQAMKCVFPNFASNVVMTDNDVIGLQSMKVMYSTTSNKLLNCVIPFCYNFSRSDLKSFLVYLKDFKDIDNVLIDKII